MAQFAEQILVAPGKSQKIGAGGRTTEAHTCWNEAHRLLSLLGQMISLVPQMDAPDWFKQSLWCAMDDMLMMPFDKDSSGKGIVHFLAAQIISDLADTADSPDPRPFVSCDQYAAARPPAFNIGPPLAAAATMLVEGIVLHWSGLPATSAFLLWEENLIRRIVNRVQSTPLGESLFQVQVHDISLSTSAHMHHEGLECMMQTCAGPQCFWHTARVCIPIWVE